VPVITSEQSPFEIGKAQVLFDGGEEASASFNPSTSSGVKSSVTIIACGQMVYYSLLAAKELEEQKITVRVINCATIKPLDKKTILAAAEETGAIVTVEEHQIHGGLGGAVSELVAEHYPVPVKRIGIEDHFGESGEPKELLEKFGLTKENIIKAVLHVVRMKEK
jgi:transketolase